MSFFFGWGFFGRKKLAVKSDGSGIQAFNKVRGYGGVGDRKEERRGSDDEVLALGFDQASRRILNKLTFSFFLDIFGGIL